MNQLLTTLAAVMLLGLAAPALADDCRITDHGAVAGDDRLDTAAIQSAIDACKDVGGRVVVPTGRFVSGQLRLGSTMEFHLSPGAILSASTDLEDFPPVLSLNASGTHRPFIIGEGVRDLAVTGLGTIDGSGPAYWGKEDVDRIRFGLIVTDCANVKIDDITVRDTPMFLSAVMRCQNVVVSGVTLLAPLDSPNTDGLQIIDSRDVRVSDCLIQVGDDGIVTKSQTRDVERLQVVNCRISSDDGAIKFGTRSNFGVRDSLFSNISITNSRYGIAIFMIQGGAYLNNRFSGIRIETGGRHARHYAIFADIDDRADSVDRQGTQNRPLGRIEGLVFDGLDISTAGNIMLGGHPRSPIRDLTLSDIRMRVVDAEDLGATVRKPTGNRTFQPVPGSPDHSRVDAHVVLGHVEGAVLRNVDARGVTASDRRPVLALPSSSDVRSDPGLEDPA